MRGDTRGQVVQIGALILLALLVLAFASYQATVVPEQTAQAEQEHNEVTATDLAQLQASVTRTVRTGSGEARTVRMAPRYPDRLLAVNPSARSGSLRTERLVVDPGAPTEQPGIEIDNAEAVDNETADYWNGDPREFETNRVRYRANYNRFRNPPTRTLEQSVLYNSFADAQVVGGEQRIIDGSTVRLTAVRGDLSESGTEAAEVSVRPASAPARSVTVTGDGGRNVSLTLLTNLSESFWRDELDGEPNAGVAGYTTNPGSFNELVIELDGAERYDLRLGAVGLGEDVPQPEAAYVVDVRGDGIAVPEGSTVGLLAGVRDRWDNAYAGADADAEVFLVSSPTPATDASVTDPGRSQEDGTVPLRFEAPDDVDGQETYCVVVDIGDGTLPGTTGQSSDCADALDSTVVDDPERAVFEITVYSPGAAPITGFTSTGVTDLLANQGSTSQTFTFSLDGELQAGEEVTLDLGDPQDSGAGANPPVVDYPDDDGSVTVVTGSGDATIQQSGRTNAEVTYTAGATGDAGGTEIEVRVDNVEVGDVANNSYDVVFDNDDAGSETDSFVVKMDNCGSTVEIKGSTVDGPIYSCGEVKVLEGGTVRGEVRADEGVVVEEGGEIQGDARSGDDDVTVNQGGNVGGGIESGGDVAVTGDGSTTVGGDVVADGTVDLNSDADIAGGVDAGGTVTVFDGASTGGSITSDTDVIVDGGTVGGGIESGGDIAVTGDGSMTVDGDLSADGSVDLNDGADIAGAVTAGGPVSVNEGANTDGGIDSGGGVSVSEGGNVGGSITADGDVTLTGDGTTTVDGDITSEGTVTLNEDATVAGDVFVDGASNLQCGENTTINGQPCEEYKDENY